MGQIEGPRCICRRRRGRRVSSIPPTRRSPTSPRRRSASTTRAASSRRCSGASATSSARNPRHLLRDTESPDRGARIVRSRRRDPGGRRPTAPTPTACARSGRVGIPSYCRGRQRDRSGLARGAHAVGMTAGASAPEILVEELFDALGAAFAGRASRPLPGRGECPFPPAGASSPSSRGLTSPAPMLPVRDRYGHTLRQQVRVGAYILKQHLRGRASAIPGADAGAAVPLQSRLRRLRQDRLSGRRSSTSGSRSRNAWPRSTSAARRWSSIAGRRAAAAQGHGQDRRGHVDAQEICRSSAPTRCCLKRRSINTSRSPYFTWSIHLDGDEEHA